MSSEIRKVLEAEKQPEAGMPGMFSQGPSISGYAVKHLKADLDDLGQVSLLDKVETDAAMSDNIVILSRDKFAFMDRYFVILKYMEKTSNGR